MKITRLSNVSFNKTRWRATLRLPFAFSAQMSLNSETKLQADFIGKTRESFLRIIADRFR